MIERLESPDSVLAFRGIGKITKEDYEKVIQPAVTAIVQESGEVRFVYLLGDDFEGFTAGAGLEDTKLGFTDFTRFKRTAVATNHDGIRHGVSLFGWMMPGDIKTFDPSELDEAIAWAAG